MDICTFFIGKKYILVYADEFHSIALLRVSAIWRQSPFDEYQQVPGTQSSSKNLRSIVKIVLLSNIFSPSISGNIIRGSCHRRRIIKVSPKSIVVSAMESNDEINKFILLSCLVLIFQQIFTLSLGPYGISESSFSIVEAEMIRSVKMGLHIQTPLKNLEVGFNQIKTVESIKVR